MTKSPLGFRGAIIGVLLFYPALVFPANITVPTFELITHASPIAGVYALQTYGNVVIQVEGGYKFGAQIDLNFLSSINPTFSLEQYPANSLGIYGASVIMRDVFGSSIDISYFVGQNDYFCRGDGFSYFGATTFATSYAGFMYFPAGPLYQGVYQVDGTGVRIDITPVIESLRFSVYAYEDTHANDLLSAYIPTSISTLPALGAYSVDVRALFNMDVVKLEGFLGGTYASASLFGYYRGGLMLYATNKDVEFFAQVGVPEWDPSSAFSINLFYLLFEPRLHLGQFSVVPTFFWHPAYYQQFSNPSEVGNFDVNVNVYFGDLVKTSIRGGIEGNFKFQSSSMTSPGILQTSTSPYVSFATAGVVWTVRTNFKFFPFDSADFFTAFIGIEATL
ncbi:MAG TPA: hypothetical protein VMU36_03170 [Spirochaetia bacterium]|nr:hypothetical protein [Spirochaetia bacterium]